MQPVSRGVARERSPRREPWGKCGASESPTKGDRIRLRERELSIAATRFRFTTLQPTADAVGYHLSLLRSYLQTLSKSELRRRRGSLDGEHLLPGFKYPVADLFKEWDS